MRFRKKAGTLKQRELDRNVGSIDHLTKLSDQQALQLLQDALQILGERQAETVRATTALTVARNALAMMTMALREAAAEKSDEVRGVIEPTIRPLH